MSQDKDPNQGEGDRASARRYNEHAEEFVREGKVPQAAQDARGYVERDPADAAKAEAKAQKGPLSSVDALVAKGHSVIDRVVGKLRERFGRK